MTTLTGVIYALDIVVAYLVLRARRLRLLSVFGFSLASILVVNYAGGALFSFADVRSYFFDVVGYPRSVSFDTGEYARFTLFMQAHLAAWLFAAFSSSSTGDIPRLAPRGHRSSSSLDRLLLVGYLAYSGLLIVHLNLYQVLLSFSNYDVLREQAADQLGYWAYVYSKGVALVASLYLLLAFRSSALRSLIIVVGILTAFATLQKSVPAYYVAAYVLAFLADRKRGNLQFVSDGSLIATAVIALAVPTAMSALAYGVSPGAAALAVARRVALLPHVLDFDAILMVDTQLKHQTANLFASFPTLENLMFGTQKYYMGSLLEKFTYASGATNASANTFYATALYLDLRWLSIPASYLLGRVFLAVDAWYARRASSADPLHLAVYIAALLTVGKLSSSHLGTVLVSEGLVFIGLFWVVVSALRESRRMVARARILVES